MNGNPFVAAKPDSLGGGAPPVCLATDAMGTRFEFVLFGSDPTRLRAAGESALDLINDWDRRLSWFSRGSVLSHLNARAGDGPVPIDRELHGLLVLSREVWRDSDGAFDITVAPLMVAWGLRNAAPSGRPDLESARSCVGMDGVEILDDPPTVRFLRPGMSLDLGSIAKGAALDAAAAVLRECGVTSALLHGGTSSVVAIGSPPGRDSWPVAIETGHGDRPVVHMCDTSLSVSAPRGRTAMTDRGPVGHIIDPRTGLPAARTGTAAVIYKSGALADAWSTALLVLGSRPRAMPHDMTAILDLHAPHENAA